MNTTPSTRPLTIEQFASLSVSPAVKEALSSTNALVHRLWAVPDDVATPELRDDADRLLDQHLPGLLAAYRDAHAAGAASADGDLIDGLEHVREELGRILAALQTLAGGTLATQRGFLEQKYPGGADALGAIAPVPDAPHDDAGREKLDARSLDALIPRAASTKPASKRAACAATGTSKFDRSEWNATNVVVAMLCIAFLAAFGVWLVGNMNAMDEAETEKISPKQVAITAVIDRFARGRGTDDTEYGPWYPTAEIKVHGTVDNKSNVPIAQAVMQVDLLVCPDVPQPKLASCKPFDAMEYDIAHNTALPAGLTTKYNFSLASRIPDVVGRLRARVTVTKISSVTPTLGLGY